MTTGARKPATGPEPVSTAERAAFDTLVRESLPGVRASAQAWRNGLAALITLATAGVFIQGRTATADLTAGWRAAVTALIGGGLVAAVVGLWQALSAEAGTRTATQTLADIHARHASVLAYQVALAGAAGASLRRARTAVAAALGLLLAGATLTWWAPAEPAAPPAYVQVTTADDATCGELSTADGGLLRLTVAGAHEQVVIPLAAVRNLAVVTSCP